jgi:hypothetical protein
LNRNKLNKVGSSKIMPAHERLANFDRHTWRRAESSRLRAPFFISALLFLSYVLTIFHISFSAFYRIRGAWPDDLIYFNALQDWQHSGSPIRGYTLLPSPYFLEFALDRILVFFTSDFELFAYVLSGIFAICLAGSFLFFGYVYCREWRRAAVISLLSYSGFYLFLIPMGIRLHVFLQNHSLASITTPAAMAMLAVSLTSTSRRSYIGWCVALSLLTGISVFSDPLFLADFLVPGAMTCVLLAILPGTRLSRLALSGFALCASGAIAMVLLELCSVFFWPHRLGFYAPVFTITDTRVLHVNGNAGLFEFLLDKHHRNLLRLFVTAFFGAAIWWGMQIRAYCAGQQESQAIQKRRLARIVLTVAGLLATVTSVAMPALRGAIPSYYEWRYFLVASMFLSLAVGGAVTYAGFFAWSVLTTHVNNERWQARQRRLLDTIDVMQVIAASTSLRLAAYAFRFAAARGAVLSGVVLLFAIGFCAVNPIRVGDKRSPATPYLSCVAAVTEREKLHDGLASAYASVILRAGRAAPQFRHEGKTFQTSFTDLFSFLEPNNNNVRWMSNELLQKEGGLDYVIFEEGRDSPAAQDNIRQFVGEPAVIEVCPHPDNFEQDGYRTYIWVYKDSAARGRLTNLVSWDNNRDVFFPPSRLGTLVVDPVFGGYSVPGEGSMRQGRRGWTREADRQGGRFFQTKPIFLPPGKYRVHICLSTEDGTSPGPLATAEVSWGGNILLRRDAGGAEREFVATFDLNAQGGPTSGNATLVTLFAGNVSDVEVCGLTIERYGLGEFFRPLSIFE